MKYLLVAVNAKYIHSNPAVYSLRAYTEKHLSDKERAEYPDDAPSIDIAEYTINQNKLEILEDIWRQQPDVIGFSCYIWNWQMIEELLVELPKLLPRTRIWLGGPEVSHDGPELLAKYPCVTGIMVGEGEATFCDLVTYYQYLEGQESCPGMKEAEDKTCPVISLKQIPGLCLRSGYTPTRELLDLDEIPFIYEDLDAFTHRIVYYETARGCPYGCSYCLSAIDKQVRFRSMDKVKQELQFFLDHRVPQVKLVDRTFNCNHTHAMEIWRYLRDHDNGVTNFHFEIAADILREDEIELLNSLRPGLAQLEIGVQTANEDTLQAINRRMDMERLQQIVASLHKGKNIHLHLDLIAGLPLEDYDSFGRSFDRVYAMRPEQLQLGFLKVLKGSPMEEKTSEYGLAYLERPPYEVLYTKWLTYAQLRKLKTIEEVLELYYNSNQYTHTLPVLEQVFDSPFRMYEQMAEYFDRKGYFLNSPARAHRYQILLDFCEEYDGGRLALYRELLTYDMYLRENLKSRPVFARELREEKQFIQDFYRREQEQREYLSAYSAYDWKQMSKMTHLEPFFYPVWDRQGMDQLLAVPEPVGYILFDYQKRDPLTYEAAVTIICTDKEKGDES
ncbi:MAG: B12-binding domain-containing radical SAM protein [Lachnospiraceae bacterium]|nr:B12-binding domain-containing radical SAM protein [Lachnospiraceae bacterium]